MDLKIKIPTVKHPKVSKETVRSKTYEDLEGEIWCPIKFNQNYKVSNKGRILTTKETIAKPFTNNSGYLCIGLWSNNHKQNYLVHILVAMHFMNYNNKYDVDHIDNDKTNNDVSNLQLITHSDNCNMRNNPKIYHVTSEGDVLKEYKSYRQAARDLGYSETTLRKNLKDSVGIVKITNYKYYKDCYFIRK